MAMITLEDDPRWRRMHEREWTCPSCGTTHIGLPELAANAPDFWQGDPAPAANSEIRGANHILTQDFCILEGKHFFVRAVLLLPIIGAPGQFFGFGAWATLSEKTFNLYVETFDSGLQGHLGPWFGWFSNRLQGYPDTINLKSQLHPQNDRQRPRIELERLDHPLAIEQRQGISLYRVLELHALYGHDFRPALTD
jgi:hypothetical protein